MTDKDLKSRKRKKTLSVDTANAFTACHAHLSTVIDTVKSDPDLADLIDTNILEDLVQGLTSSMAGRMERIAHLKKPNLKQLGIRPDPRDLVLREQIIYDVIDVSANCKKDHIWSSEMLYNHLKRLVKFVSPNEAGARLWINAFFFRVDAILERPDSGLLLSLEQYLNVPVESSITLNGSVGYALLWGPKAATENFFKHSDITLKTQECLSFFVEEAKRHDVPLEDYLPQTVGEMFAGMRVMDETVIRGALTNGRCWIFIILEAVEGGAVYHTTDRIDLFVSIENTFGPPQLSKQRCDLVAGIIAQWVNNSHKKLDENDCIGYASERPTTFIPNIV